MITEEGAGNAGSNENTSSNESATGTAAAPAVEAPATPSAADLDKTADEKTLADLTSNTASTEPTASAPEAATTEAPAAQYVYGDTVKVQLIVNDAPAGEPSNPKVYEHAFAVSDEPIGFMLNRFAKAKLGLDLIAIAAAAKTKAFTLHGPNGEIDIESASCELGLADGTELTFNILATE